MRETRIVEQIDVAALPRGSRSSFLVPIVPLGDGSTLHLPIKVVVGREPGPCLALVAGVHGDEAEGIVAVHSLWQDRRWEPLRGSVILIAIANPPAFGAHQRRSPLDGLDLNRVFPGRPDGTPSERLAHRLFHLVTQNAHFLLTLHSWYATGDCLPHVEFQDGDSPVRAASLEAARASGFERVRAANWHRGLFPRAVSDAGIPSLEAEVGGMGCVRGENRALIQRHVDALMRHLGLLRSTSKRLPTAKVYRSLDVIAPCGGWLHEPVALGSDVAGGDAIGRVSDPSCETMHEIHCPRTGTIVAVRRFISVSPGDIVYRLFFC